MEEGETERHQTGVGAADMDLKGGPTPSKGEIIVEVPVTLAVELSLDVVYSFIIVISGCLFCTLEREPTNEPTTGWDDGQTHSFWRRREGERQ